MAKGNGNCQDTYKNPDLKKRAMVSAKAKAKKKAAPKKKDKKKVPPKMMMPEMHKMMPFKKG